MLPEPPPGSIRVHLMLRCCDHPLQLLPIARWRLRSLPRRAMLRSTKPRDPIRCHRDARPWPSAARIRSGGTLPAPPTPLPAPESVRPATTNARPRRKPQIPEWTPDPCATAAARSLPPCPLRRVLCLSVACCALSAKQHGHTLGSRPGPELPETTPVAAGRPLPPPQFRRPTHRAAAALPAAPANRNQAPRFKARTMSCDWHSFSDARMQVQRQRWPLKQPAPGNRGVPPCEAQTIFAENHVNQLPSSPLYSHLLTCSTSTERSFTAAVDVLFSTFEHWHSPARRVWLPTPSQAPAAAGRRAAPPAAACPSPAAAPRSRSPEKQGRSQGPKDICFSHRKKDLHACAQRRCRAQDHL